MTGIIACTLDLPLLAEAALARGLQLVPVGAAGLRTRPDGTAAALLGCAPGEQMHHVREARALGWHGPLMLVLAEGGDQGVAPALDAGADDAVVLPASPGEIAARLAARIRHCGAASLAIGALRIDRVERRVFRAGVPIALLPREYALLLHFVQHAGNCVSRAELLQSVWGLRFDPGTNVVDVHVSRLRSKLDRGFAVPMLRTEKGRGYWLDPAGS